VSPSSPKRHVSRIGGRGPQRPALGGVATGRMLADFHGYTFHVETGHEVLTLRDHTASVICVAFSPDGHRLVSGSMNRTARIWDATPVAPGGLPADSSAH